MKTGNPRKILIIDNNPVSATAIQLKLKKQNDFKVSSLVESFETALGIIKTSIPDIILVDILYYGTFTGPDIIQTLTTDFPSIKVLTMGNNVDPDCISKALKSGASGYLNKTEPVEAFEFALKSVLKNLPYISSDLLQTLSHENIRLKQSQIFRFLEENSPDCIIKFDLEKRLRYVNLPGLKIIQAEIDNVLDKTPPEIFSSTRIANQIDSLVSSVISRPESIEIEMNFGNDTNGDPVYHLLRTIPEFDIEGNVSSVILVGHDISVRKAMENNLIEREKRYREIIENSEDSIILVSINDNNEFIFLEINHVFERFVNLRRKDIIGRTLHESLTDKLADLLNLKFSRCFEFGHTYEEEAEIDLFNDIKIIHSSYIPVRDKNGKIYRITAIIKDITEKKNISEKLQLLGFALNQVDEAALLFDEYGNIKYVNQKACTFLGYQQEEFLNLKLSQIDLQLVSSQWETQWKYIKDNGSCTMETCFKTKSGEIFPVEVTANYFEYSGREFNLVMARNISDQKKHQQELFSRGEEFRTLAENIPDYIVRFDKLGKQTYCNQNLLMLFGDPGKERSNKKDPENIADIFNESAKFRETLQSVLRTGFSAEIEEEVLNYHGSRQIHQFRFVAEFDKNGNVTGALTIGRDITGLKEIEQKLKDSESKLKLTLEAAKISTWEWDIKNEKVTVSRNYFNLLGFKPEPGPIDVDEYLKRIHPDEKDYIRKKIINVLSGHETEFQEEVRVLNANGSYRWYFISGQLVTIYHEQNSSRMLGVQMDINDRKQAGEKLHFWEGAFRAIVENTPDVIVRVDKNCKRIYINPALERSGMDISRLIGTTPEEVPFDDTQEALEAAKSVQNTIERVLKTGQPEKMEVSWRAKNGDIKHFLAQYVPEFNQCGNVISVLSVSRDITDRYQMEQTLAEREKEFRQLAGKLVQQVELQLDLKRFARLTPREQEVFILTGRGLSYIEISRELNISENTVNSFKNRIKEKLELRNYTELLHLAMQYVMQSL